MELEIVHLYHDLLNTYGDDGNIKIIKRRAEKRGIAVNVKNVTVGDRIGKCDIMFLGGGQDFEQTIASADLIQNRRDFIRGYVEDSGVLLAICGGYQLMGEYYVAADKTKMEGLNILPIRTDAGNRRIIGNLILENELETLVGFENHSGRTFIGDLKPLGAFRRRQQRDGQNGGGGLQKHHLHLYAWPVPFQKPLYLRRYYKACADEKIRVCGFGADR